VNNLFIMLMQSAVLNDECEMSIMNSLCLDKTGKAGGGGIERNRE
jgi:hypothetical protein